MLFYNSQPPRTHFNLDHLSSHSPSNTFPYPLDFNGSPSSPDFEDKSLYNQFDSFNLSSTPVADHTYMNNGYSHNPAIRLQESTPQPAQQQFGGYQQQSQFEGRDNSSWSSLGRERLVARPSPHSPSGSRAGSHHRRGQSSSSIGSTSSFGHNTSYPYSLSESSPSVVSSGKLSQPFSDGSARGRYPNHIPSPSETPTEALMGGGYPGYVPHQQSQNLSPVTASTANHMTLDQPTGMDDEMPGMSHSNRHSISSYGGDPSTPRTAPLDSPEDSYKSNDMTIRPTIPKLDRTISNVYEDELYNPATAPPMQPSSTQSSHKFLSPIPNSVSERLQAAQMARSQSARSQTDSIKDHSRHPSPFRPNSQYSYEPSFAAASTLSRQQQEAEAAERERRALAQRRRQQEEPKTISPKDALLDYHESAEDTKMSLFPASESSGVGAQQYVSGHAQNNYARGSFQNDAAQARYAGINTPVTNGWTSHAGPSASTYGLAMTQPQQQQGGFGFSMPSTLPFLEQQTFRTPTMPASAPMKNEDNPEFPDFPHLTTMDSSASEAPASSNGAANHISTSIESHKPSATLADTGTYTCTYHGCTQRFETPQKLQRHKREGHRGAQATRTVTPGIGSGMSSAQLMARNSQAGPHVCERINPTTGKPCNTIFSRPYDLTRHEDTIHNAKKQKVRCALCVEEKTFSRNDALTRHMRVVHPDVDFPGKHRRRGAHD